MLKSARKFAKYQMSTAKPIDKWWSSDEFHEYIPNWFGWFSRNCRIACDPSGDQMERFEKLRRLSLLQQTRGAGTPPPLVKLQSKMKFLKTVTDAPPSLTGAERSFIIAGLRSIKKRIPAEATTGLKTKSKVTITEAATFTSLRKEGGTLEDVRRMLMSSEGELVPIRCLETGKLLKRVPRD